MATIKQFLESGLFLKGNYIVVFDGERQKVAGVLTEHGDGLEVFMKNEELMNAPIEVLYQTQELTQLYIEGVK